MQVDHDFKILLRRELEQRMTRNPRYSMRAFAKDMKIAPALMSDILNGKRGLSRESATVLSKNLGLTRTETEVFCDLVESKHARSKIAREQAVQRLKQRAGKGIVLKFLTLDQEKFNLLSDWYNFAILELMKTPGYVDDASWIAKRLNLSSHQVNTATARMLKLGVVEKVNGVLKPTHSVIKTPDGLGSRAIRLQHEQMLKKASEALFTQAVDERDFRGLTIKCKKSDVSRVREKLKKFLIDLDIELSEDADATEVYQLSTQFFCLTQTIQKPEGNEK